MLLLIFKITVPIKAYFKSSKIDKLLIFLQFRSNLQQNACFFFFFFFFFFNGFQFKYIKIQSLQTFPFSLISEWTI